MPYEILFIDDGSRDESVPLLRESGTSGGRTRRAWSCWRATRASTLAILAGFELGARQLRHHARCGLCRTRRKKSRTSSR